MPEYLDGYGIGYRSVEDFKQALENLMENYLSAVESIANYPNNLTKTCQEYEELFGDLLAQRDEILFKRAKKRSPLFFLRHNLAL